MRYSHAHGTNTQLAGAGERRTAYSASVDAVGAGTPGDAPASASSRPRHLSSIHSLMFMTRRGRNAGGDGRTSTNNARAAQIAVVGGEASVVSSTRSSSFDLTTGVCRRSEPASGGAVMAGRTLCLLTLMCHAGESTEQAHWSRRLNRAPQPPSSRWPKSR